MRVIEKKISFSEIMMFIIILLVISEMSKLPKPILKIRDAEKEFEKDDFINEYSKIVDDAIKVADDDLR